MSDLTADDMFDAMLILKAQRYAAEAKLAAIEAIMQKADTDPELRRNALDYLDDIYEVLHPDRLPIGDSALTLHPKEGQ